VKKATRQYCVTVALSASLFHAASEVIITCLVILLGFHIRLI